MSGCGQVRDLEEEGLTKITEKKRAFRPSEAHHPFLKTGEGRAILYEKGGVYARHTSKGENSG